MTNGVQYSDEFLNAYLDNELSQSDKSALLAALRHDEALNQRMCQLQRVRSMVQLAYQHVESPDEETAQINTRRVLDKRYGIAASVLLLLGTLGGWYGYEYAHKPTGLVEIAQGIYGNQNQQTGEWQVMLHVSSNDPFKYATILDETENLLRTANEQKQKVTVQILGNSKGLAIFSDDQSAHAKRIRSLQLQYPNLLLAACGKTLQRLKQANRPLPKLLPQARVVPSALSEVISKQKQGWTYIRI